MNPALIPSLLVGAAVLLALLAVLACIGVRSRPDDETIDLIDTCPACEAAGSFSIGTFPHTCGVGWRAESRSRGGRP